LIASKQFFQSLLQLLIDQQEMNVDLMTNATVLNAFKVSALHPVILEEHARQPMIAQLLHIVILIAWSVQIH